jgi:hypothetical protein
MWSLWNKPSQTPSHRSAIHMLVTIDIQHTTCPFEWKMSRSHRILKHGCTTPERLNFIWQGLTVVGPQYGSCFMSAFWCLKFLDGSYIFAKSVHIPFQELNPWTLCFITTRNNSTPTTRILITFYIWGFFENLARKFKFHYNTKRIMATLHEDLCTFIIIPRWILLTTRNAANKSCREKSKHTPSVQ